MPPLNKVELHSPHEYLKNGIFINKNVQKEKLQQNNNEEETTANNKLNSMVIEINNTNFTDGVNDKNQGCEEVKISFYDGNGSKEHPGTFINLNVEKQTLQHDNNDEETPPNLSGGVSSMVKVTDNSTNNVIRLVETRINIIIPPGLLDLIAKDQEELEALDDDGSEETPEFRGNGIPCNSDISLMRKATEPLCKNRPDEKNIKIINPPSHVDLTDLRKVYGISSFEHLAVFVCSTVEYNTPQVREFLKNQVWILIPLLISFLIIVYGQKKNSDKKRLLFLFSRAILRPIIVAWVITYFEAERAIQVICSAFTVVFGLFLYTLQSSRNFNMKYVFTYTVLCIFIIEIFIQEFLSTDESIKNFIRTVTEALLLSSYMISNIKKIHEEKDYMKSCIDNKLSFLFL